ncbi:hypothetical protein ACFWDI_16650 [Streptomyces sp. NPDC060064]|uniref:hypothetical protein n=1 Tax=Streptomyces sp. NPDC060064 TaxID=3347049 RepID=UPI0036827BFA
MSLSPARTVKMKARTVKMKRDFSSPASNARRDRETLGAEHAFSLLTRSVPV